MYESKKRASAKWDKKNLYRLGLALPIDLKEPMKDRAYVLGISVNKYIRNLIENDLKEGKSGN